MCSVVRLSRACKLGTLGLRQRELNERRGLAGMADDKDNPLKSLIELGQIDAARGRISAERQTFDAKFRELEKNFADQSAIASALKVELENHKATYIRREKELKEEQQKLIDRRKALSTLADYKAQQAAGREIDAAAKVLDVHEEELIALLEGTDAKEAAVAQAEEQLSQAKEAFEKIQSEAEETLAELEQREADCVSDRDKIVANVAANFLSEYEKVIARVPDPVAAIDQEKLLCSACFISVGPQLVVQIHRAETVVKCPGCARILYLDTAASSAAKEE